MTHGKTILIICAGIEKATAITFAGSGVTVNCLHPGVIATDVFRDFPKWMRKLGGRLLTSPEKGAAPSVRLAVDPALVDVSGEYFNKMKRKTVPGKFTTPEVMEAFRLGLDGLK